MKSKPKPKSNLKTAWSKVGNLSTLKSLSSLGDGDFVISIIDMSQVSFAKKVLVLLHIPFIPLFLVGQFGIGLNSHYQDCLYMLENGFYARPTMNFFLISIIYILLNLLYLFVLWTHHQRLPKLLLSQSKRIYGFSFCIHIAIYLLGLLRFFYLDCADMWGL